MNTLNTLIRSKNASTVLPKALILGLLGALLVSITMVSTVTSSSQTTNIRLASETFVSDADVEIMPKGVKVAKNQTAIGDTEAGAVEINSPKAKLWTDTINGNYSYKVRVMEMANTSFQAGEVYRVEVFGDNGTATTLLGTLYFKQDVVKDTVIEEAELEFDLGSSTDIYDDYSVIVTQVQ